MNPDTVRELVNLVGLWGIPWSDEMINCGEGIALLANLVNWSAKVVDYEYYDLKEELVQEALLRCTNSWQDGTVAYVETCVGQVSFHIFDDMEDFGRTHGEWSQEPTQERANELLREWMSM